MQLTSSNNYQTLREFVTGEGFRLITETSAKIKLQVQSLLDKASEILLKVIGIHQRTSTDFQMRMK